MNAKLRQPVAMSRQSQATFVVCGLWHICAMPLTPPR